ncbi:MAG: hypothetical protein EHM64_06485, partial [Ignavibacteriae bacterium]
MNTSSTNPTTASSRWTHFSGMIRKSYGLSFAAGLTIALLLANFVIGCKEESPGIITPCVTPTVIRTSPASGAANVPLSKISNATESAFAAMGKKSSSLAKTGGTAKSTSVATVKVISATFSTPMDPNSITTSTFTVWQGTTPILGGVSYTDTTAQFFIPNGLEPNLTYTCTITTGVRDMSGNAMENNYMWNFSTALGNLNPPTVSSTDPANSATGVALNQKLAATFSTAMDASTFTTPTFTLRQGATSVQGFISYSGTTAIFAPSVILSPNTAYTARISTAAKDLAGNALANDFVWSFTTGSSVVVTAPKVSLTDPVNAAVNVALNQKLAATFSKTMDATTLTTSTFTLKQGSTPVQGFVSYSGTTAIFAPTSNLTSSTVYTA